MENNIHYTYFWYHHGLGWGKGNPVFNKIEKALSERDWELFNEAKADLQTVIDEWNKTTKKKWSISDFLLDKISRVDRNKHYGERGWYMTVPLTEKNFAKITDFESECG